MPNWAALARGNRVLNPLIQTDELEGMLTEPSLRLLDGSWHLDGRSGWADYLACRIPGAVWFDLDGNSDPATDLPHMVPPHADLAEGFGKLGLARTDRIVIYDTRGIWSAPRLWWMLRLLGAEQVQVLDGGLPKWRREGRPVVAGEPDAIAPASFVPQYRPQLLADLEAVRQSLGTPVQVLDARPTARFKGEQPEPRPGLRGGHMPGAVNVPFSACLTEQGTLKSAAELAAVFEQHGVDMSRPVITSCGSGVTAAIISLALGTLGVEARLYDGSWAEWGADAAGTPVETG